MNGSQCANAWHVCLLSLPRTAVARTATASSPAQTLVLALNLANARGDKEVSRVGDADTDWVRRQCRCIPLSQARVALLCCSLPRKRFQQIAQGVRVYPCSAALGAAGGVDQASVKQRVCVEVQHKAHPSQHVCASVASSLFPSPATNEFCPTSVGVMQARAGQSTP